MNYKKFLSTFIVSSLLISLTACSKDKLNPQGSSSSIPSSSSSSPSSATISSSSETPSSSQEPSSSKKESSSEDSALEPTSPTLNGDLTKIADIPNKKQGWGQGTNKNELNQPLDCLRYQDKFGKYNAKFIETNEKKIYLTFDEGYENGYTGKILDVLKEKGVSAVFFVTMPYVKSQPDLIKRMIDEGHIVGNHSVKHKSFPDMPLDAAHADIKELHEYMLNEYHYEMTLFRFPMGEFSERTLALLNQMGYKSIFWSFAYLDYDVEKQPEKEAALKRITSNAHNGAIYLLHAVSKTNTEILGDVIDEFRKQGFEVAKYPKTVNMQ